MDATTILQLLNYGVLGILFVLWLSGFIYPKGVVKDKDATITELKESVKIERTRADTAVEVADLLRRVLEAPKKNNRSGDHR